MASRTKQKEEARARRLAEERGLADRERRQRRVRMLGGVLIGAVAVLAVLIAVSVGGGNGATGLKKGTQASKLVSHVNTLLAGIPENGTTLGDPTAKVTVTEFGDLECPICRDFALGAENNLISNDVRSGKVKLVYRSLLTATGNGPDPNIFVPQQSAAYAAGLQGKAWYYIELFYNEQGQEGTGYVNSSYLDKLAQQVSGLSYTKWLSDSQRQTLANQVSADERLAASLGFNSTPTFTIAGPKGQTQPVVGDTDYGTLETAINAVL